jgi:hypothetical protein
MALVILPPYSHDLIPNPFLRLSERSAALPVSDEGVLGALSLGKVSLAKNLQGYQILQPPDKVLAPLLLIHSTQP